jgi:hypothetical protein
MEPEAKVVKIKRLKKQITGYITFFKWTKLGKRSKKLKKILFKRQTKNIL